MTTTLTKKIGIGTTILTITSLILWAISRPDILVETSGNITCGVECISFINITSQNKTIYFYNPEATELSFSPEIKDYAFCKKDGRVTKPETYKDCGVGWKPLNLSQPFYYKYSYVLRWNKGEKYEYKLVGHKINPSDTVKWAVKSYNGEVDPVWFGEKANWVQKETFKEGILTRIEYKSVKDEFEGLDAVLDADKPKVKLYKWNREEFLEISLPVTISSKSLDNGKLSQTYSEGKVNLYPVIKNNSDEMFEFEIVINQKPTVNYVVLDLNYSDLECYYQSSLNSKGDKNCNETDCWNTEGKIINHRPENIVGSYAVYSSNKRDNEYKTGKLFHIYRPLVMDADGKTIWADLKIENKKLKITISQEFLDNAVYPIIIDPSFGYTTIGGYYTTQTFRGTMYASGTNGGTVTSLTAYVSTPGGATKNYEFGIYGEDSGGVSTHIGHTVQDDGSFTNPPPSGAWITLVADGTFSVSNSLNYYLCFWTEDVSSNVNFFYDEATFHDAYGSGTFDTWPAPITWDYIDTTNGNKWSIYVNTSVAGDSTAPTYTNNRTNTTTPLNGTDVMINTTFTDETALSRTWCGNNFTSAWINETPVTRTGLSANHTNITLFSAGTSKVGCYQCYANDTSKNKVSTLVSCIVSQAGAAPPAEVGYFCPIIDGCIVDGKPDGIIS
jgi:hypothetical protein